MNVPFMSPSTIVNQHSHLHMVCILNWLVARPKQCLNWRCICLGSYITCLLLWCNRMELELPWGPITEVISYIVEKLEIAKNLHFCRCFFSDIFKYGNIFSIWISYNNVCLSTLTIIILEEVEMAKKYPYQILNNFNFANG